MAGDYFKLASWDSLINYEKDQRSIVLLAFEKVFNEDLYI